MRDRWQQPCRGGEWSPQGTIYPRTIPELPQNYTRTVSEIMGVEDEESVEAEAGQGCRCRLSSEDSPTPGPQLHANLGPTGHGV